MPPRVKVPPKPSLNVDVPHAGAAPRAAGRRSACIVRGVPTVAVYGIDHVQLAIPVGGEALARRFYGELHGLVEFPKPSNLAARGGAWFRCGPMQLHLGVESDFRAARKAHPALLVSDLACLLKTLTAADCEVKYDSEPVQGLDRAFTSEPFGEIALSSSGPMQNRSPNPALNRTGRNALSLLCASARPAG